MNFEFPTSQLYEITITSPAGKVVYRYSMGRQFLQAFQTVSLRPKETLKRVETWNYQLEQSRVPAGEYLLHVKLKAVSLNGKPITDNTRLSYTQKIRIPERNPIFRNVKVTGTNGEYLISGEARTTTGTIFMTVEDGHREYLSGNRKSTARRWQRFEFRVKIPFDRLPKNATLMLYLSEKDSAGQNTHGYPAVIQRFNHH